MNLNELLLNQESAREVSVKLKFGPKLHTLQISHAQSFRFPTKIINKQNELH